MNAQGVMGAMGHSVFLADLDRDDREPRRIAVAIIAGLAAGVVAAGAALIAVLMFYQVVTGHAGDGIQGLGRAAVALKSANGARLAPAVLMLAVPGATNGALALTFVALAAIMAHHPLAAYISAARRPRVRLLIAGLVLSVLVMAPPILADRWLAPGGRLPLLMVSPLPVGRTLYAIAAVLLLIPAAAAEELFFRGWLLRQLAAFSRRSSVLIIVTGLAFSAMHFDFSPGAFITRALMGAGFAYMTLRLGGIEFSTGVHATNNILIVLFIEPLTLKTAAAPTDLTTGSLIEDAFLIAGYVLITEAVARIGPLRRWAGVGQKELSN